MCNCWLCRDVREVPTFEETARATAGRQLALELAEGMTFWEVFDLYATTAKAVGVLLKYDVAGRSEALAFADVYLRTLRSFLLGTLDEVLAEAGVS